MDWWGVVSLPLGLVEVEAHIYSLPEETVLGEARLEMVSLGWEGGGGAGRRGMAWENEDGCRSASFLGDRGSLADFLRKTFERREGK